MKRVKLVILSAILGVSACKGEDKTSIATAPEVTADIILRATSDIQTSSPIKAVSFVPNTVATWLGHIILLDEKGTLHRATADSAETETVAIGKYSDVVGLFREKKSGAFLALTPQGQIKAFVQTDDEGNFGPMAVSMSNLNIERFCAQSTPIDTYIWVKTAKNISQKLSIETFDDTSVTLKEINSNDGEIDPCNSDGVIRLSQTYAIRPDTTTNGLIVSSGQDQITVKITNGLSIRKVQEPGFMTVTTANMGSVYNEGILLIAEKNEGRLVLISRAYVMKEISER